MSSPNTLRTFAWNCRTDSIFNVGWMVACITKCCLHCVMMAHQNRATLLFRMNNIRLRIYEVRNLQFFQLLKFKLREHAFPSSFGVWFFFLFFYLKHSIHSIRTLIILFTLENFRFWNRSHRSDYNEYWNGHWIWQSELTYWIIYSSLPVSAKWQQLPSWQW